MKSYNFIILGNPLAQGRPRFFVRQGKSGGKFVGAYDPATSKSWKETIKWQVIEQKPEIISGPVAMTLHFMLPRPKGHFRTGKNDKVLKPSAPKYHIVKPDIDNLEKAVKDALRSICYRDDCQIISTTVTKEYGNHTTGVNIELTEVISGT